MRITIIGSNGKMGHTFFQKFQEAGHMLAGIDLPFSDEELFASVKDAELILFCIPKIRMNINA